MADRDTNAIAYVAGFFDADGCVVAGDRSQRSFSGTYTRIAIVNTDLHVLEVIRYVLSSLGITCTIRKRLRSSSKHSDCYTLEVSAAYDVMRFADLIGDYAILKSHRLRLAAEHWILRRAEGTRGTVHKRQKEQIVLEIQALNSKRR